MARRVQVPRLLGTPPNIKRRRQEARLGGWRRNEVWLNKIYGYRGHQERAAYSLLGYKPKYLSYTKTTVQLGESVLALGETGAPIASGAEASTSAAGSEPTDPLQEIEPYSSPSSSENMDRRRPSYKPINLEEIIFGDGADPLSAPSVGGSNQASGSSSAAEVAPVVPPSSAETIREGVRLEKRVRSEIPSRGGSSSTASHRSYQGKASAPAREESGSVEPGPGSASVSRLIGSPPFWPELQLEHGRPLNVEERLSGSSAVIAALCRACALPKDMERHNAADNAKLLMTAVQTSIANVQSLQVVLDRYLLDDAKISRLEDEKKKHGAALETMSEELKKAEAKKAELEAQVDGAMAEITNLKAEITNLKAETNQLKGKLHAKEKRSAELELVKKQKADLISSVKAEIDAAFKEGYEDAGRKYVDQIKELRPKLFKLGCRAVLKEMGFSEDHPMYINPPKLTPAASTPHPAPISVDAIPTEDLPPPPETPRDI